MSTTERVDAVEVGDGERTIDRWSDPNLLLVLAAVLALAALLPTAARALITLPLALLLPGHALLAALDRPDRVLTSGARVALRVALSTALVSLSVLLIGAAFGVNRVTVIIAVWVVCSLAALAAWGRVVPARRAAAGSTVTQSGVLLALAVVAAMGVVAVALALLPAPRDAPYSRIALWGTSRSSGSPLVVSSGRTAEVQVEVENQTGRERVYRVIPAIDAGLVWKAPEIRLRDGERWRGTVEGRIPEDACVSRLTIALARGGRDSGVRPLVLYLRNEAGDACD